MIEHLAGLHSFLPTTKVNSVQSSSGSGQASALPAPTAPANSIRSLALHNHHHHFSITHHGGHRGRYRPTMLFRPVARAPALRAASMAVSRRLPIVQQRTFFPESLNDRKLIEEKYPDQPTLREAEDPGMNGGFVNPPPIKRQFRDPHGDWWDKQERRNFGEPVHEDNDTLGIFSAYEYTWVDSKTAFAQIGVFIAAFVGVCWVVGKAYPDKPSFPREFEGGLERELGGPGAVRARAPGDPEPFQSEQTTE